MKVALKAPFDNSPKHYDDMVCRIRDNDGFRAQGVLLECGTQGWFSMHRSGYHQNMAITDPDNAAITNLGHPWHIIRLLNHEQVDALRSVLGELPAPGKGDVQVVGSEAQTPAPAASTANH